MFMGIHGCFVHGNCFEAKTGSLQSVLHAIQFGRSSSGLSDSSSSTTKSKQQQQHSAKLRGLLQKLRCRTPVGRYVTTMAKAKRTSEAAPASNKRSRRTTTAAAAADEAAADPDQQQQPAAAPAAAEPAAATTSNRRRKQPTAKAAAAAAAAADDGDTAPEPSASKKGRGSKPKAAKAAAAAADDPAAAAKPAGKGKGAAAAGGGAAKPKPPFYLVKSEPDEFSIDMLKQRPNQTEGWEGVRNYVARNHLRAMRLGDLAFFYHSSCKVPGIVGIVEVVREAYPDTTAQDKSSTYYDPKTSPEDPRWSMVDFKLVRELKRQVTLEELKQHKQGALAQMALFTTARLSVQPVSKDEWDFVLSLEEQPADS